MLVSMTSLVTCTGVPNKMTSELCGLISSSTVIFKPDTQTFVCLRLTMVLTGIGSVSGLFLLHLPPTFPQQQISTLPQGNEETRQLQPVVLTNAVAWAHRQQHGDVT